MAKDKDSKQAAIRTRQGKRTAISVSSSLALHPETLSAQWEAKVNHAEMECLQGHPRICAIWFFREERKKVVHEERTGGGRCLRLHPQ
jgi:hypothetical protein